MDQKKNGQKKMTTTAGCPVYHNEDSQTVGPRGPILLQDYYLHEKMATFNRERIPERIVHAKGTGVFGTFKVTHDISKYTRAKLFSKVGNECKTFVRFSTVAGEKGSADTERDPRGFAVKLYTEGGNWDLVGNNTPVFFVKDPKKFGDFIHSQKRDTRTNLRNPTWMWDFWSLTPESLHQVMILMSDRGTPYGHRHMNGYSSHTYSMVNDKDKRVWVKFHWKTNQGIKNFIDAEAGLMKGMDPDFAQRDMVEHVDKCDFPSWTLHIQVMTDEQAKEFKWNPFDLTKVWPHGDFPLIEVGQMELNEMPGNYFQDVEQSAFAPANIVDGIGFSPDKMLQGRILSYPDAHRYRIGVNYESLPVNRCPFAHNPHHRDGAMRFDGNNNGGPNYFPNSFDNTILDESAKGIPFDLDSKTAGYFDRNENDDDHYSQPGMLFRDVMSDTDRANTISNIVNHMSGIDGEKKDEIIQRQLCHFYRADEQLGQGVADGLGVKIQMPSHH